MRKSETYQLRWTLSLDKLCKAEWDMCTASELFRRSSFVIFDSSRQQIEHAPRRRQEMWKLSRQRDAQAEHHVAHAGSQHPSLVVVQLLATPRHGVSRVSLSTYLLISWARCSHRTWLISCLLFAFINFNELNCCQNISTRCFCLKRFMQMIRNFMDTLFSTSRWC